MKHLFNYSVYQQAEELPGNGYGLSGIGCGGLELLTSFKSVPECFRGISPGVHLPFATDWYSGWTGKADTGEFDEENVKYVMFGRDAGEIIKNLGSAILFASEAEPAYGVLHAGAADLNEVMLREQTGSSSDVLREFCEMMNRTVSGFKGGEPPFRLAFENLWWPGLKLLDPWEYRFISKHIEFDNWGFCLDTGHMMNALPDAYDEDICTDRLLKIFDRYPEDMKDRIGTVHLHVSTSAEYRNTFEPRQRPPGETMQETIAFAYPHIMKVDQHRPFSGSGCVSLIDELSPDFVTHELIGPSTEDALRAFIEQRAHFPMH